MKTAIFLASAVEPSASSVAWGRLAGLLMAVAFPAVFWTSVLALAGYGLGYPVGTAALASCGFAVAACSFLGLSVILSGKAGRE